MKRHSRTLFTIVAALLAAAGLTRADETSSFYLEQALVHHIKPTEVTYQYPVIMVPGLNLSSYIYLTTPDGRLGWAQEFADAGYEVYVINDPRFDFSRGFGVSGFADVPEEGAPPATPDAQQGWSQDIWRRWGFGSSEGNPYPDAKFPTDAFDAFAENYPYLGSSSFGFDAAVGALLQQVGPAILMAHSAGGPKAVSAAKEHPRLVAGLVLIEPTGPPTEADFPSLSGMSMLGVYGDYIASRRQSGRKAGVEEAARLFNENGGIGKVVSLPDDLGIPGNSHLMMQDRNNDFIADLITSWLHVNAKTPARPGKGGSGSGGRPRGETMTETDSVTDPQPQSPAGGMMSRFFAQLDANGDGKLSMEEFSGGRRFRGASEADVKSAFGAADTDGDGYVTAEEQGASMGGRGGRMRGGARGGGAPGGGSR